MFPSLPFFSFSFLFISCCVYLLLAFLHRSLSFLMVGGFVKNRKLYKKSKVYKKL